MERLDHIDDVTPAGAPLQVRYERPLWVVVDNGTVRRSLRAGPGSHTSVMCTAGRCRWTSS